MPFKELETVKLKLKVTTVIEKQLEELVRTGLYGKKPEEAAERLVGEGIRGCIKDGTIKRRK